MPAPFARDNDLIQRMFNEAFMIVRTNIERTYGKILRVVSG
ncbi:MULTISPECIES: hypothetical protein [Burkholderiaceae]|uniref:Uncharacterized protein n=1 Tax=Caballeronia sordidicola TaxID=196367 RepID=A0A242MNN5_CABSO|nr:MULTISPECIES: hypothetical protein [Burkholderiaceae]OTP72790.1 hypothetical protein PAMC26577_19865 [Caballeronia sordidicola]